MFSPPRDVTFGEGRARGRAAGIVLAALALAAAISASSILQRGPVARLDAWSLDVFERLSAPASPGPASVVVDIDEPSLSAVGQWPWPRYRLATLVQSIAAQHPAAIGLDIVMPEADRTSLANLQATYRRDFGLDITFAGLPEGLMDNDGFLGQVCADANVVGASYLYFDHATADTAPPRPGVGFDGRLDLLNLPDAPGAMTSTPAIAGQIRQSGFMNVRADPDGALRRMPMLIRHAGVVHPSLALSTVLRALNLSGATIESGGSGLAIRAGSYRIPIDEEGRAILRFEGAPSVYPSLSAVDVLNGNVRREDLHGKVVYIGTSAAGLNDMHRTAMSPVFPGLKLHAVVTEDILRQRGVGLPSWGGAAVIAASLLGALLLTGLFLGGSGVAGLVAACALGGILPVGASAALFAEAGLLVPAGAPLATSLILFVFFLGLRVASEKHRARAWRRRLENARQVTIESMASVAETRDPETGAHIKRTQHYVRAIARELKRSGHHSDVLTEAFIKLLFLSAPLHDIGKVGVPDHILLKPGRLTDEEMTLMKQHAEFGRRIIFSTAERIEGDNFLAVAGEIAGTHHEKWDGTGYPLGLVGRAIPLSGRIMAVADVYDALISRRCYKEPFSHAHSLTLMHGMSGTTFDPTVFAAFLRIEPEIIRIAQDFRDEPTEPQVEAGKVPGRRVVPGGCPTVRR